MAKQTKNKVPPLPSLLDRKIYKTGQTRGADDDEIFQNRVSRNSTVLIPFSVYEQVLSSLPTGESFQKGYIVLITPKKYFASANIKRELKRLGLTLGENLLVFYEQREDWNSYHPDSMGLSPAKSRTSPLGGQYVARIPATTSVTNGQKISIGFHTTKPKGAGIRFYEYASDLMTTNCRIQLESLFWLCHDSKQVAVENGMTENNSILRRENTLSSATSKKLLDFNKLIKSRIIDKDHNTICPLCLEKLSSSGFFNKMEQAEGREVSDLTITQLNLFHINELRLGELNHSTYNLGWGHHHCNVVVKDAGIKATIEWMKKIVKKNTDIGYL